MIKRNFKRFYSLESLEKHFNKNNGFVFNDKQDQSRIRVGNQHYVYMIDNSGTLLLEHINDENLSYMLVDTHLIKL